MIDLHTHILPGLDDGAGSVQEALEMARAAVRDGVHTVVATPHCGSDGAASWSAIQEGVANLQATLDKEGISLRVLPGAEVYLAPEAVQAAEPKGAFALNGSRYVLLELPLQQFPLYTEQVIFELQIKGLLPILAHPERNIAIQSDLGLLERLVQRGVLVQVTTTSLLGRFGPRVRQCTEALATRQMAHIIASDAHSSHLRPPVLREAMQAAARLVGEERAQAMTTATPARVLADQLVPLPEPALEDQGRGGGLFGRRR